MRNRVAWLFVLCAGFGSAAHAGSEEEAKAREAVRVLDEIMQAPDRRVPDALLRDAEAVAVIPDVLKAGLARTQGAAHEHLPMPSLGLVRTPHTANHT